MANLTVGQANAICIVIRFLAGAQTGEQASEALELLREAAEAKLMAGPMRGEGRVAIAAVEQLRAELETYRGDTRHIIELREDGWTIQHPMACRPDLFGCAVNQAAHRDLDDPPGPDPGRYYCDLADGWLAIGEPVEATGV